MADLDNEVRNRVYSVLEGTLSLDDFEHWFVSSTWDDRTTLVARIDHLLAEKDLFSEDEFIRELAQLVATIWHGEVAGAFKTESTAVTIRSERMHLSGTETIRQRLEFADT